MKKFISIFLMLGLFVLTSFGQRGDNQQTVVNQSLPYSATWFQYPGIATDTIGASDSIWYYTVGKLTTNKVKLNVWFNLDSVGGTAAPVNIYIQKKVHDLADFVDTDTIVWTSGVDTIFEYETATSHTADFWRTYIEGTTDGFNAKVNRLDGKIVIP